MRAPLPYILIAVVAVGAAMGVALQSAYRPGQMPTAPSGKLVSSGHASNDKSPAEAPDAKTTAVTQFREVIARLNERLPAALEPHKLVALSFDVQDSDSLIAPVAGALTFREREHFESGKKSADDIFGEHTYIYEWHANYAWTSGQWQCVFVERKCTEATNRYSSLDEQRNAFSLSFMRSASGELRDKLLAEKSVWEHERLREADHPAVRVLVQAGRAQQPTAGGVPPRSP